MMQIFPNRDAYVTYLTYFDRGTSVWRGKPVHVARQIYFRAPSTKYQNLVLVFAQFRANILLKQHFYTRLFQNI